MFNDSKQKVINFMDELEKDRSRIDARKSFENSPEAKIALYNNTSKEEVLKHVEPENLRNDFNRVKASQLIIESAVVIE